MTKTNNNTANNSVTPATPANTKQVKQKAKLNKKTQEANKFKAKYFEYYDDVKTHNNGPYDW